MIVRLTAFFLLVALGATLGFLALETAGAAMLLAIPVLVVVRQRGLRTFSAAVIALGVGDLASVAFFIARDSAFAGGVGVAAFAASQFVVAVAVLVTGVLLAYRQQRAAREAGMSPFHPGSGRGA